MDADQRLGRRVTCKARFMGATAGTLRGEITDVSETGLRLIAQGGTLKRGASLHLEFSLPTGRVEAVGEVRWVKKGEQGSASAGIRFVRISAESQKIIAKARQGQVAGSKR